MRARTPMQLAQEVIAWYWNWRKGPVDADPVAVGGLAPSNNMQLTMNLVMPLKDKTAVGRAELMKAMAYSIDELFTGLNNVGTVHFARFDIIDGNLCMISVYDGDPKGYIRDFIVMFGNVFDALMDFVVKPPPTPSAENVDEFLDWIMEHDAFHIPGGIASMFPDLESMDYLARDLVLLMYEHDNVQLGVYRGCPGFSAAKIRDEMGVGW